MPVAMRLVSVQVAGLTMLTVSSSELRTNTGNAAANEAGGAVWASTGGQTAGSKPATAHSQAARLRTETFTEISFQGQPSSVPGGHGRTAGSRGLRTGIHCSPQHVAMNLRGPNGSRLEVRHIPGSPSPGSHRFCTKRPIQPACYGPSAGWTGRRPSAQPPVGPAWSLHEGITVSSDPAPGAGGASQYSGVTLLGPWDRSTLSAEDLARKPIAEACLLSRRINQRRSRRSKWSGTLASARLTYTMKRMKRYLMATTQQIRVVRAIKVR